MAKEKMNTEEGNYKTSDLYFAAYLRVAGVTLLDSHRDPEDRKRVWFVFDKSGPVSIRDLKQQYFNRSSRVPALSFVDEIRVMKQLTHETD